MNSFSFAGLGPHMIEGLTNIVGDQKPAKEGLAWLELMLCSQSGRAVGNRDSWTMQE